MYDSRLTVTYPGHTAAIDAVGLKTRNIENGSTFRRHNNIGKYSCKQQLWEKTQYRTDHIIIQTIPRESVDGRIMIFDQLHIYEH